jgi:Histidine kinase-, DNA gyrase B-, and HSP90-like ATPase
MITTISFSVNPKLATLLGKSYKTTETALKELIDNAHDADADNVWVTLPEPLEPLPIITIKDDGSGMMPKEIEEGYLQIASDRATRIGLKSNKYQRTVKGRKGIGKFAGLAIAEVMQIETKARGKNSKLTIDKQLLKNATNDLEKVKLPIDTTDIENKNDKGTTVTLSGLNTNLNFPNPVRLRQILVREYRNCNNLNIFVNGEKLGVQDIAGKTKTIEYDLPHAGKGKLIITTADKAQSDYGAVFRVNDKIVGGSFNLLENHEIIPNKLQRRSVCEIQCDGLADDVSANWDFISESSKALQELKDFAASHIQEEIEDTFKTDMKMAIARHQKKINLQLQKLPEYKRPFAEKQLYSVLKKFYDETDDRINTIINVIIDSIEKDAYWNVLSNIKDSRNSDIEKLSEALHEFGFLEMAMISNSAIARLQFIEELQLLSQNDDTLESIMHNSFDGNLWLLGNEYSMCISNKSMKNTIEELLNKKYKGDSADKRPDLLLSSSSNKEHLLIEFKRPSHTLTRDDEFQAVKYKDDLKTYFTDTHIKIILIGGKVKDNINFQDVHKDVKYLTYRQLLSDSHNSLNWLIDELGKDNLIEKN